MMLEEKTEEQEVTQLEPGARLGFSLIDRTFTIYGNRLGLLAFVADFSDWLFNRRLRYSDSTLDIDELWPKEIWCDSKRIVKRHIEVIIDTDSVTGRRERSVRILDHDEDNGNAVLGFGVTTSTEEVSVVFTSGTLFNFYRLTGSPEFFSDFIKRISRIAGEDSGTDMIDLGHLRIEFKVTNAQPEYAVEESWHEYEIYDVDLRDLKRHCWSQHDTCFTSEGNVFGIFGTAAWYAEVAQSMLLSLCQGTRHLVLDFSRRVILMPNGEFVETERLQKSHWTDSVVLSCGDLLPENTELLRFEFSETYWVIHEELPPKCKILFRVKDGVPELAMNRSGWIELIRRLSFLCYISGKLRPEERSSARIRTTDFDPDQWTNGDADVQPEYLVFGLL